MSASEKLERFRDILTGAGRCSVAFSGGVDSTFLLAAAVKFLGSGNVLALTAVPPYVAGWEIREAEELAEKLGVKHIKLQLPMLDSIASNPVNRCYLCKSALFSVMQSEAEKEGFSYLCDGSNADDLGDYRPGMKALKELGVASPMVEAGLAKEDIRIFSKEWDLPTWNKPPYACLLTRLPHDTPVLPSVLDLIEKSEKVMIDEGFPYVRVRHQGDTARIEIPREEFGSFMKEEHYGTVDLKLKELGYHHVTLDLGGYKMGNMNRETKDNG